MRAPNIDMQMASTSSISESLFVFVVLLFLYLCSLRCSPQFGSCCCAGRGLFSVCSGGDGDGDVDADWALALLSCCIACYVYMYVAVSCYLFAYLLFFCYWFYNLICLLTRDCQLVAFKSCCCCFTNTLHMQVSSFSSRPAATSTALRGSLKIVLTAIRTQVNSHFGYACVPFKR